MAVAEYIFSMKSEEEQGASQPNIVRVDLASDADASTFATNLETLFSADVVSIDKLVQSNYTLPYPAGTDRAWRVVIRTPGATPFHAVQTEYLFDVDTAANASAFAAAWIDLTGAFWLPPDYSTDSTELAGIAIGSIDVYDFPVLPQSH